MVDVKAFLEDYSFDKAFLGSVLIEFSDEKYEALNDLIGLVATDEVVVSWEEDISSSQRSRLREQTRDLPIPRQEDFSGVLAFKTK